MQRRTGPLPVRLTATANGWKVGACSVTVTGAVSAVIGGERLLPESGPQRCLARHADPAQFCQRGTGNTVRRHTDVPWLTPEGGTADSR